MVKRKSSRNIDINQYLVIDLYRNTLNIIKYIYIFDFESKKSYCGRNPLGAAYDYIYHDNLKSILIAYSYVIPINDKNKLEILMKMNAMIFLNKDIKDFLKKYDLEEWLI